MSSNNDPLFADIVKKLKDEFQLSKLYLFGSRSDGRATEDSDYDLVAIVSESNRPRFKREVDARLALQDIPAAIDIFVFTETEFEQARRELGSVAETAFIEGQEIHIGEF